MDLDLCTINMDLDLRKAGRELGQVITHKTGLEGLLVLEPTVHGDDRGFFMESYNRRDFLEAGIDAVFVQDNQSRSRKGVLRGMHFQKKHPQGKLVRVLRGEVFDVAVDLRMNSPTLGRWFGILLSEENHRQMYIPEGFAHGYVVLSETADFFYKATDFFCPEDEGGMYWMDPDVGIQWPVIPVPVPSGDSEGSRFMLEDGTELVTSEKDRHWPSFRDVYRFNLP